MDDTTAIANGAVHVNRTLRVEYLEHKLQEAELLLAYAAESGIELEPKIRAAVMKARMADGDGKWTADIAECLLDALTVLSMKVRPVTVESVRLCPNSSQAKGLIRF